VGGKLNGRGNLTLEKLVEIAFALEKRIEFRLRELFSCRSERSHLKLVVSNQRAEAAQFQLAMPPTAAPTKHSPAA